MNKNETSIIKWMLLLPIFGVLLTSFLLTNIFISSKYSSHEKEIEYLKNNHIEDIKNRIKNRVDNLSLLLEKNYSNRNEALDFIKNISFEDKSYIFVIDKNMTTLIHRNQLLENLPFDMLTDKKIKENIKKIVTVAIEDKNKFIEYQQSKKIFHEFIPSKKISYVKYIPKFNFVIGTGLYTDDLQKQIQRVDQNLKERLIKDIQNILLVSLIITIVIIILLFYFSKRLKVIFNSYSKRIKENNKNLLNLNSQLENKVEEQIALLREKDLVLNQQSKMAAMGEMLGNIAHQWRQPLSAISTIASGIKLKKEFDSLDDEILEEDLENIVQTTIMLSNTIDDFRSFYARDKEKKNFYIDELVTKVLKLISANLENKEIQIILDIDKIEVFSYENELIQVLLNILNNAKDALLNKKDERYVFISSYKKGDDIIIEIYDNAGGIEENILSRIYEPYFSTKFKSQGTGIGLYMSKNIVENNLDGEITTQNINFVYKDSNFVGALFKIKIPLK